MKKERIKDSLERAKGLGDLIILSENADITINERVREIQGLLDEVLEGIEKD